MKEKVNTLKKVVIIGSGIVGATAAYQLGRRGFDVTVIDRNEPGRATDAAAGIIAPWLAQRRNKPWYRLVRHSAAYYPQLIEELKEDGEKDTGYKRVGVLRLHDQEKRMNKMIERTTERRKEAPEIGDIIPLTVEETQEKIPVLTDEFFSLYVSGGARVSGRHLRQALIQGAKKHGVTFIDGSASLRLVNESEAEVLVDGKVIESDAIINAAGAWARPLFCDIGIDFLASGQKAQLLHLQIDEETKDWPVVMPPSRHYMVAFDGGRIVVGATYEEHKNFEKTVTVEGTHEVLTNTLRFSPGLHQAHIVEPRVGFRPKTPHSMPVFGQVKEVPNVYAANGLGASGLTAGPFVGLQLAKLIAGETPDVDPDDYALSLVYNNDEEETE